MDNTTFAKYEFQTTENPEMYENTYKMDDTTSFATDESTTALPPVDTTPGPINLEDPTSSGGDGDGIVYLLGFLFFLLLVVIVVFNWYGKIKIQIEQYNILKAIKQKARKPRDNTSVAAAHDTPTNGQAQRSAQAEGGNHGTGTGKVAENDATEDVELPTYDKAVEMADMASSTREKSPGYDNVESKCVSKRDEDKYAVSDETKKKSE